MKDCIDPRIFNRFLEDSLDSEALARLEDHCRTCEACAGELAKWKALKEKLQNVADVEVPHDLKEKVMSRIAGEKILPSTKNGGIRRNLAAIAVFTAALYCILRPLLRPMLLNMMSGILKSMSVLWYNALSAIGLDPALLLRLLGKVVAGYASLLPVFVASTIVMVAGLIMLIAKGKAARQPG